MINQGPAPGLVGVWGRKTSVLGSGLANCARAAPFHFSSRSVPMEPPSCVLSPSVPVLEGDFSFHLFAKVQTQGTRMSLSVGLVWDGGSCADAPCNGDWSKLLTSVILRPWNRCDLCHSTGNSIKL